MQLKGAVSARKIPCLIVLCAAFVSAVRSGYAQSIDETYRLALKEGELNVYGTLTPDTAMKVLQ